MAPKVVDLDDIVINWAWNTFIRTRSKDYNKLRFEDVKIEIVWDRVKFISGKPEYSDERKLEKPNSQVVFKSVFNNSSDHYQEHSFQTDRSTVSSCSTTVTKGYTRGINLELKLGLPNDIMSATAGFGREVTMESSDESVHEEMVSWSINSTIKVPPKHRTVAELVVKEQEFTASFKMATRIRGRVVAIVTNLRDNNAFIQSIESSFAEILNGVAEQYGKHFSVEKDVVTWEVSGDCQFRFGIEQHVQLYENPLNDFSASILS